MGIEAAPPPAQRDARAEAFLVHPRLRPALTGYCREMIEVDPEGWPIAKLFNQFGRYMVGFLQIHHYHAWRHYGGPLPTLARLQATSSLSPRQTASIVAGLRAGGLLTIEPANSRSRGHILAPSRQLTAAITRSMLAFLRAADALELPIEPRASRIESDSTLQNELVYRSAAFVLTGNGTLLDPFPRVMHFATKDCGYLILTAIMAAIYAHLAGERSPSLSYRRLAKHFRISPSHVGNLMTLAMRERWFATDGRGRIVHAEQSFIEEFEHWSALELAHYASIADAILAGKSEVSTGEHIWDQ